MGTTFSQFFPPTPSFTEKNLPRQDGKVFIVTGAASGIGYQLAKMLYEAGGKVYVAGRSEAKAQEAMTQIRSSVRPESSSTGALDYLHLELDDLSSIKASAESFCRRESKLNVLWNNAGVSLPPEGSKSTQGHELQLATNCLGPYLFTQLLLPQLQTAAETSPSCSVRVIWTSSTMVDLSAPAGGVHIPDLTSPPVNDQTKIYVESKVGNWFLASQLARDVGRHGILSVTQNPGNVKTNLLRHAPSIMRLASAPLLYPAKMGAYTELWAGLSPELTMAQNGCYVIPWGRIHPAPRKDLFAALTPTGEGGTGQAAEFRDWCEKQTAEYR
jgi:NAD(P)-dependent dehydrogenase (short-subunit alcohol dehydrogenase family)